MQINPIYNIETSLGDFSIELDATNAPITVENFIGYAESDHYIGTIFNRVMKDFMIQGGGYTADGMKKNTFSPIKNEATNGLKNTRGSIAMARQPEIHSATAQFFINLVDNPFLDHKDESAENFGYCVFGKVISGMNIADKISLVETTSNERDKNIPIVPVEILKTSKKQFKKINTCK